MKIEVFRYPAILRADEIQKAMQIMKPEKIDLQEGKVEDINLAILRKAYYTVANKNGVLIVRRIPEFGKSKHIQEYAPQGVNYQEIHIGDHADLLSDEYVENIMPKSVVIFEAGHEGEMFAGGIVVKGDHDRSDIDIYPKSPLISVY